MGLHNRLNVAENPYQQPRKYKRVLCVCSAGCLRSPTAAVVLARNPYNFNTRAAGADTDHAIIPIDQVLIAWADQIVCMEQRHLDTMIMFNKDDEALIREKAIVLGIPDKYEYRAPKLIELIRKAYEKHRPEAQG